jgi:transposase InsO family protein
MHGAAARRAGALDDAALTARIRRIHKTSRGTYGAPRIHAEPCEEGTAIGCKRVARLMRRAGLAGVRPSMGSVGEAYDNAMCESFFTTLEFELIDRRRFHDQNQARIKVFEFIEGWYIPRRRHSALGYQSSINYERSLPSRKSLTVHESGATPGARTILVEIGLKLARHVGALDPETLEESRQSVRFRTFPRSRAIPPCHSRFRKRRPPP